MTKCMHRQKYSRAVLRKEIKFYDFQNENSTEISSVQISTKNIIIIIIIIIIVNFRDMVMTLIITRDILTRIKNSKFCKYIKGLSESELFNDSASNRHFITRGKRVGHLVDLTV